MWQKLLKKILEKSRRSAEQQQPPCDERQRSEFEVKVRNALGVSLPQEYLELIAITNGLNHNGLTIYATKRGLIQGYADRMMDGMLEANSEYREFEPMANFLVLGEDGTVFYARDLRSGRYVVCLTVGLTELESHSTCGDLFVSAFKSHP